MNSWSTYFPFAKGDQLFIDGPFTYNGTGEVIENDGGVLEVLIKMPEMSLADIPPVVARLRIEASFEGAGNKVSATLNAIEATDHGASIKDGGATRRVMPSLGSSGIDVTAISGHRASIKVQGWEFTISRPPKHS